MFEQVEIPPNEPMPIGFQEKPVYITELDEVGVFSFVFPLFISLYTSPSLDLSQQHVNMRRFSSMKKSINSFG